MNIVGLAVILALIIIPLVKLWDDFSIDHPKLFPYVFWGVVIILPILAMIFGFTD